MLGEILVEVIGGLILLALVSLGAYLKSPRVKDFVRRGYGRLVTKLHGLLYGLVRWLGDYWQLVLALLLLMGVAIGAVLLATSYGPLLLVMLALMLANALFVNWLHSRYRSSVTSGRQEMSISGGEIVFIDRFNAGNKGWNLNYWGSHNPRKTNRIENSSMVFEATESDLKDEAFGAYFDLTDGIHQGNEYEVNCKVKSDENTTMEFSLWLHDTTGGDSNINTNSRTPSTKFEEFKLGFTANKHEAIRIHLHNKPGLGRIIVDEVVARKI